MNAIEQFTTLQSKLLDFYRVNAKSRYVELVRPAMRAHVLEIGSGEPIVVLHGGDGEAVNWAPTLAHLQEWAHVFAVDRPGFGLSDAFDYRGVNLRTHAEDFVISLLDALHLDSATLVGGSMGGFFTLAATLANPRRVNRLVLVGYAAGMTRDLPLPLRLICGVPGLAKLFVKGRPTLEAQKRQYRQMFHVDLEKVPTLYFETRIAGINLPSSQGGQTGIPTWAVLLPRIANLRGIRDEAYLGDELPAISVPTLMIMGELDMTTREVAKRALGRIPNSRFEFLSGIGHFPFLEAPERTAALIQEFSIDRDTPTMGHRAD
jgi:pimeloyl-ACP methyl ester carboxylesterase